MLIKTIIDGENTELKFNEKDYDEAFAERLSCQISEYYIHTVYTHDYESSSDAGDGRDDYYKEEADEQISLDQCVIKNNQFFGVICESFGEQSLLTLDCPEIIIYHPKNYGGKNYHYYRDKKFQLIKK